MNVGSPRDREQGVALVTSLLLTLIAVVLGAGLLVSSRGAQRTETGFKNQQRTFEAAVAGLEHAREVVRRQIFGTTTNTYSSVLAASASGDGVLTASNTLAGFSVVNGVPTVDDVPIVTDTALGGITYRVYLTNDPWDGPTSTADGNNPEGKHVVTLTSFARGENNEGFTAVQALYRDGIGVPLPQLPGVVTLPGPAVEFFKGSSSQSEIIGDGGDPPCYAAVAASTNAAEAAIVDEIQNNGPNRSTKYTTCNPVGAGTLNATNGAVENFIDTTGFTNPYEAASNVPILTPPGNGALNGAVGGCVGNATDFIRKPCMDGIVAKFQAQAASLGGFVGASPTTAQLGTPTNPKIVVATGNLTLGPGTYGGVLVAQGNLTMNGNTSYTGLILAIGTGSVTRNGGGNGEVCGGILVVDTVDNNDDGFDDFAANGAATIANGWVARPFYQHNGGGTSMTGTCRDVLNGDFTAGAFPLQRIAFQQLR